MTIMSDHESKEGSVQLKKGAQLPSPTVGISPVAVPLADFESNGFSSYGLNRR